MLIGWVAALALVFSLFNGWFERNENPNQALANVGEGGLAAVRLRQNRQGHYVAQGQINDEPVLFLLDTGATQVSVPGEVAERLGLRPGRQGLAKTAAGVVTTYSTTLDSVDLGPIRLRNVRAHINPHMPGEQILLGMSFLRHLDFEQTGRQLTLRQRP